MTTTRLTRKTEANLAALGDVLAEIAQLNQRAERLKWEILDSYEAGSQTAVAWAYGVTRSAVGQWVSTRANRTVARRSIETGRLYCMRPECAPKDGDALEGVSFQDLEDGGVCAHCGGDVLINDTRKTA